jgi:hypothetical protein
MKGTGNGFLRYPGFYFFPAIPMEVLSMPVDNSTIAKRYVDAIQGDTLEVAILIKLPELVTCNDWTRVEILGAVEYISERTKAEYKGLMVKYSGGLYFIKQKLVVALGAIDKRFKNVKKTLRIV